MLNTQLLKYVKTIIDDETAMNILFYSVKKTMSDNGYSLATVLKIEISDVYQEEPVVINIKRAFPDQCASLALLLSLRALIIYPNLLKYCSDDNLLFLPYGDREYGWTIYSTIVLNCYTDNEFCTTYDIFESVVFGGVLGDEEAEKLNGFIVEPERKFLVHYYERLAGGKFPHKNVILNNAFVGDENMENYVIGKTVKYVGNTAFAFCRNLKTIEIEGDRVQFGLFPIVECDALEGIIVPKDSVDYYKEALPFYMDIIGTDIEDIKKKAEQIKIEENQSKHSISKTIEKTKIDLSKLHSVFNSKVTSYKYFWLLAILGLIKDKGLMAYSNKELSVRMIAEAWPLLTKYELDFGRRDQMKKMIDVIKSKAPVRGSDAKSVETQILSYYDRADLEPKLAPLLKNVPYRFLAPWIKFTTNDDVIGKSKLTKSGTPYALVDDGIIIDEDWFDYFVENYEKEVAFVSSELQAYLNINNSFFSMIKYKCHSFIR